MRNGVFGVAVIGIAVTALDCHPNSVIAPEELACQGCFEPSPGGPLGQTIALSSRGRCS